MNTYIDARQITISSKTADSINDTLKSVAYFSFPAFLKDEDDIIQTQISIHSAQIPLSYYNLNQYNNTLVYQFGTGTVQTAVFTEGNYTANSFIAEMKIKIPTISVLFNSTNGKFIFAKSSQFTFYASGSTCFPIMGFDSNVTGTNITAKYPANFAGITRIKIASSELNTFALDSYTGGYSSNLAIIPINNSSYGILLYENNSGYKPILRNKSLNGFDIQLLDDNNNVINFNNIDWYITLQMDITRKLEMMDRVFPKLTNIIPSSLGDFPAEDAQNTDTKKDENADAPNAPDLPTTGDDDLDFLLYQRNIYQ